MTLTTQYHQLLDDDGHSPLELTWEIEYVPSKNLTFLVFSKTVKSVKLKVNGWLIEQQRAQVATLPGAKERHVVDLYEQAEIAYAHLLDEEALLAKCQEHWDTDGHRDWNEPGRAA